MSWMDQAECRNHDPEMFFPDESASPLPAILIWRTCPVQTACAQYALDTKPKFGVYAGMRISTLDRNRSKKLRRRTEGMVRDWTSRTVPATRNSGSCRECRAWMVSVSDKPLPQGARQYGGRGLCNTCLQRLRRAEKKAAVS